MISPYVRRLRLATEVRALRAGAGLTADQLGKRIGRSRADISRLENGHVVDQADVIKILDVLGVDGDRWTQVVTIAREARQEPWGLHEMHVVDPDGVLLIFVQIPPEHPLRRDTRG